MCRKDALPIPPGLLLGGPGRSGCAASRRAYARQGGVELGFVRQQMHSSPSKIDLPAEIFREKHLAHDNAGLRVSTCRA
jgi:hypothetical protein